MGFLFILKRVGFFIIDNWRVVVTGLAILVVIIAAMFTYKSCTKPKVKLDEKQIQEVHRAIETRNEDRLKTILAEADTKDDNIDAGLKQAELNTANAKKNYDGLTIEQLQAEAESRK